MNNIPNFTEAIATSDIINLSSEKANSLYTNLVKVSVTYMIMARLGLNPDNIYSPQDFVGIEKFNTIRVLNTVGVATSDIAEMALLPISKTIRTLNITNRTFDTKETSKYNELANKNEGSFYDERNNIHETRRLSTSGFGTAGTTGESGIGNVVGYEENLSKTASQNQILQLSDNRNSNSTLVGGSTESSRVGGNLNQTDGGETRGDGATESERYDEMGSLDEQYQEFGTGDSKRTGDIRLEYYDRQHEDKSLPFFDEDETINEMFRLTPHLKASKKEIKYFFEQNTDNVAVLLPIKNGFDNVSSNYIKKSISLKSLPTFSLF